MTCKFVLPFKMSDGDLVVDYPNIEASQQGPVKATILKDNGPACNNKMSLPLTFSWSPDSSSTNGHCRTHLQPSRRRLHYVIQRQVKTNLAKPLQLENELIKPTLSTDHNPQLAYTYTVISHMKFSL